MDAQVAISSDFLKGFSRLPRGVQSDVSKFITKFQANPTSSSINYEKIRDAREPGMRSVRIDQKYRGIVFKPKSGTIFMLLWVDDHDDAYAWARRHKCNINPDTGTLQVYSAQQIDSSQKNRLKEKEPEINAPAAFDGLKDRQLKQLGVPDEQIELVRQVQSENELDAVESQLPVEAYEGLFYIIAGSSFEDVMNDRFQMSEQNQSDPVDVDDFSAALQRLSSQRQFTVVEDELELQKMLNAPLQQWRVFLHPSQRKLATGVKNGPVRVLGGAGTGKTVVAMHRAKWLAENVAQAGKKILFTTFTKNLALDIEENLSSICPPDLMKKIEVVNLDQWVSHYLKKMNYNYTIKFNTDAEWGLALDLAPRDLKLSDAFYKEEWGRVIQPQSITTVDQYKRASRIGRGTRLNRLQRVKIWAVFEEYRALLLRENNKEFDDAYRDAADLLAHDNSGSPYAAVVVDEAQDMGTQAFNLIRRIVPEGKNDILIVGDGHQRIYGRNKVVLSHCGINIKGRARKLKINYRTTDEIRRWAVNLLEGLPVDDLDGGLDDQQGYKSLFHGDIPQLEQFSNSDEQSSFIVKLLQQREAEGGHLHDLCIVARTNKERDAVGLLLKTAGVAIHLLDKRGDDQEHPDRVRLATMHRVKGLEFEEMIVASLNDGLVPLSYAIEDASDSVEQRQADLEERALLYVAITRAKKSAVLLSYGTPSPYL